MFSDPSATCIDGEIRLVSSPHEHAGRVEICHDNHYGTVCEDDWSTEDANVVCGQMGYEKFGKQTNKYTIYIVLYCIYN